MIYPSVCYEIYGNEAGRIVAQSGTNGFSPETLPTSSQNNQFDDNNRQMQFNGQSLSYDANGNLVDDGQRTYHWNVRNQLVEIRQGGSTIARFAYDPLGRRVSKTEDGQTVTYLYDGHDTVQETHGNTVIPVLTGPGIDQRYARTDNGGRTYFLTDHLGSTRALTNADGDIVQRYDYDPYGVTIASSGGFSNPYQYTGRERDQSGLYYYRVRYYSSGMGRFISEDPIGLLGGINLYGYVDGNPMSWIDPYGKAPFLAVIVPVVIGIGVGLAIDYGLEKYKETMCACDESDTALGPEISAGVGGAAGLTGPFASKPRGGISSGGPSGSRTSPASIINHGASGKGLYGPQTRRVLTKLTRASSKAIPGLGAALTVYGIYDAVTCQ